MTRLRNRVSPVAVGILTVVWVLLWGPSVWVVVSGLVVSVLVLVVFPLPPWPVRVRLHPWAFVVLLVVFWRDLVRASLQVAWLAVGPGASRATGEVVRVRLGLDSDLLEAVTAELVSLVPGTVVLDLDPERAELTVHVLGTSAGVDVARAEASIRAQAQRVARAVEVREAS